MTTLDTLVADGGYFPLVAVDTANHRFRLGQVVFEVVEDPVDGYRSSLDEVHILDASALQQNFPSVEVRVIEGRTRSGIAADDKEYGFEGWSLVTRDGLIVLSCGTENTNGYYPCFVFEYEPPDRVRERTKDDRDALLLRKARIL